MGAGQSSGGPGMESAGGPMEKVCYYELLGVGRLATDDEIRRAYKRKALELHPDRNFKDEERATQRFAEVQTAYEVLSDPQQRAWYDSHRTAILRGFDEDDSARTVGDPGVYNNVKLTTASHIFALIGRFNSSVPMTDNSDGFYGSLRETFDQLAVEEAAASRAEGMEGLEYPSFGQSRDDFSSVVRPFYAAWSSFSTRKSFAWKDVYRLYEAPDRRTRRAMEKENKKLRSEAVREFNDAVRSLVQLARKRDIRYAAGLAKSAARSEQVMRKEAAQQSARSRAANQEKIAAQSEYVVPDWVRSGSPGPHDGEFSRSESESTQQEIECVVCKKSFKTENAYETHEKSKKHKKAVQRLKYKMQKEDRELDLGAPGEAIGKVDASTLEDLELLDIQEPSANPETTAPDPEPYKRKQRLVGGQQDEFRVPGGLSCASSGDSVYMSRSKSEDPSDGRTVKDDEKTIPTFSDDLSSLSSQAQDAPNPEPKIGKAKLKRQKKAVKKAALEESHSETKCGVCNNSFPSRTKLFKHVRDAGHAKPLGINQAQPHAKSRGGKNQKS